MSGCDFWCHFPTRSGRLWILGNSSDWFAEVWQKNINTTEGALWTLGFSLAAGCASHCL